MSGKAEGGRRLWKIRFRSGQGSGGLKHMMPLGHGKMLAFAKGDKKSLWSFSQEWSNLPVLSLKKDASENYTLIAFCIICVFLMFSQGHEKTEDMLRIKRLKTQLSATCGLELDSLL